MKSKIIFASLGFAALSMFVATPVLAGQGDPISGVGVSEDNKQIIGHPTGDNQAGIGNNYASSKSNTAGKAKVGDQGGATPGEQEKGWNGKRYSGSKVKDECDQGFNEPGSKVKDECDQGRARTADTHKKPPPPK